MEFTLSLRMSEGTIATRSRDSDQPIRMQVSFELLQLYYILQLSNPIIISIKIGCRLSTL